MVMIDDPDIDKGKRYIPKQYLYDFVFGEDSSQVGRKSSNWMRNDGIIRFSWLSQDTVYESTAKRLVQDVLNGYNATVFAYGATGAGKTHTMVGTSSNPGIMVRALNDIFLTSKQQSDKVDFTVNCRSMADFYFTSIYCTLTSGDNVVHGNLQREHPRFVKSKHRAFRTSRRFTWSKRSCFRINRINDEFDRRGNLQFNFDELILKY